MYIGFCGRTTAADENSEIYILKSGAVVVCAGARYYTASSLTLFRIL